MSVALVGAGPGDPELITVRGLACLRRAEAVVHDRLVSPELVAAAPAAALRFDVGAIGCESQRDRAGQFIQRTLRHCAAQSHSADEDRYARRSGLEFRR